MAELSLGLNMVYVPKTITEFLLEVSKIGDFSQKSSVIQDFVQKLELEMKKIDGFKRELPLCMLLLNDAIGRLKQEAMQIEGVKTRSGSDEFSPLKEKIGGEISEKKNWMSKVQLWSTDSSFDQKKMTNEGDGMSESDIPIKVKEGAFVPYKEESGIKKGETVAGFPLMSPVAELGFSGSGFKRSCKFGSLFENQDQIMVRNNSPQQQQQSQNSRKQRRSWSPDLHRRFVDALQELGGSQVATPKQIRDLMGVEGLTNDEVKSHLQKYRLHIRKLPAAEASGPSMDRDQSGRQVMKAAISQSGSPQGPLLASGTGKGMSSSGGNSMDAEEDEKSDGRSWRGGGVH